MIVTISADKLPLKQEYFDEKGKLIRTIEYQKVKTFSGRRVPSVMRVIPANKPGEYTEFIQLDLQLDVKVDPALFTLQALKR